MFLPWPLDKYWFNLWCALELFTLSYTCLRLALGDIYERKLKLLLHQMKIGMREVRWFHRKQPHHINCVRFPVTAGLPVHLKHSPIRQLGTENIQSASKVRWEHGACHEPCSLKPTDFLTIRHDLWQYVTEICRQWIDPVTLAPQLPQRTRSNSQWNNNCPFSIVGTRSPLEYEWKFNGCQTATCHALIRNSNPQKLKKLYCAFYNVDGLKILIRQFPVVKKKRDWESKKKNFWVNQLSKYM